VLLPCPRRSHVDLLGDRKGIVNLDAEIARSLLSIVSGRSAPSYGSMAAAAIWRCSTWRTGPHADFQCDGRSASPWSVGATGFVEGRNVAVDYRWADNQLDRLPALAAELVVRRVAVIVTVSATAAALAAKAATSTIPIVFAIGADPVKFGLVASMNRPGGNATGVSFLANTLVAKQLQLLQGLSPSSRLIGVLVNPGNPNAASDRAMVEAAASSLRLQVRLVDTVHARDFDAAFDDLHRAQAAAVLVFPDALFTDARERLVDLAARHRLPALFSERTYVEAGGLISYGSSRIDAFRDAGIYAGRILRGENPADLPVMQPTKFELVINLKTAKALGLDLPPTLLALADEVIE
jgi:putative ABC transport system substrate-binding protein